MDFTTINLLILKNQLVMMQMTLLNNSTPRMNSISWGQQARLIKQIEETKEAIKTIESR